MPLLEGKNGLVLGVANKNSIAWAIARACHREGARLAFAAANERMAAKCAPLAATLAEGDPPPVWPCDVEDDAALDRLLEQAGAHFGGRLDVVVHSVAYAERDDLRGPYAETSRAGFAKALSVSAYSLAALARRAAPLMGGGGSIVTLTYLGAERVFPGYNVMGPAKAALEASVRYLAHDLGPGGVRVNAVSAGPIQTLSARGIPGFAGILERYADRAALRRTTDPGEVADAAVFLLSPLGRGVTGEVLYVDGGYRSAGL